MVREQPDLLPEPSYRRGLIKKVLGTLLEPFTPH